MNFSLFQEVGQKEVEIRKRSRKKKNFNYLKSTVISTSCANLQLVLLKVEGYFLPSGEISVKFREISLKMKSRSSIYNSFSCKIWPVRVVNMRKYCIDHFALGYGADKNIALPTSHIPSILGIYHWTSSMMDGNKTIPANPIGIRIRNDFDRWPSDIWTKALKKEMVVSINFKHGVGSTDLETFYQNWRKISQTSNSVNLSKNFFVNFFD